MQKRVVLLGASGMIGKLILDECLKSNQIASIIIIVRKELEIKHSKLTQIIHNDFSNYEKIEHLLKGIDICYYCLGVYTGVVSTEDFIKIIVDYPFQLAQVLRKHNAQLSFCLLSGDGADRSEKSVLLFAKQKGIIENKLLKLGFAHLFCCRPGYIFPEQERIEPNRMYKIIRVFYKPISWLYPNFGIASSQLAKAMFQIGLSDLKQDIFSNKDLRKFNP